MSYITTNRISSYKSTFNNYESNYTFQYDNVGNITQINLDGSIKYRYQYDNIGQLVREDNSDTGKTYVYTYDNAGNLLSKKIYPYTTASTPSGTPVTYSYTYNDAAWGDLLTAYRGIAITYDNIGNPLNYYNSNAYTFTWTQGRRLATAIVGSKGMSFTYDDNGIRTSKVVSGVEHTYTLDGTRIVSEAWGDHLLVYLYDDSGLPAGMQYRNTSYAKDVFDTYWFEKSLQGDIVAIYNSAGVKLASYIYDAWGNFTVTYSNGGGTTAAQYNPFTYRGYYYDSDLGLYYLNSRYYDSNTGRFIGADGQLNDSLLGYNLFAYCENNPVMYIDPTGEFAFTTAIIIGLIVGAIIGGTIGGIYAYNEASAAGATGLELTGYTLLGILGGGTIGAFAGGFLGYAFPTVSAFMSTSFPLMTLPTVFGEAIGVTTIYVTGSQIVAGGAIITSVLVFSRIGKSGGYIIDHHYPNDHEPPHVHISGDDGSTRVGLDGKPIQNDRPMTPGERKAFYNLYNKIVEALQIWFP